MAIFTGSEHLTLPAHWPFCRYFFTFYEYKV